MKKGHLTVKQTNGQFVAKFQNADQTVVKYGKTDREALNKVQRAL